MSQSRFIEKMIAKQMKMYVTRFVPSDFTILDNIHINLKA